jgi:hypothetical protein
MFAGRTVLYPAASLLCGRIPAQIGSFRAIAERPAAEEPLAPSGWPAERLVGKTGMVGTEQDFVVVNSNGARKRFG